MRKLQVAQNNSLHAIAKTDYHYSTDLLHRELGIEWLDVQLNKSLCVEMYKHVHNMNPVHNYNKVKWVTHDRELRSADRTELVIRRTNTKLADMNMFVRGPTVWTRLPVEIRKMETLSGFKRQLRMIDGFTHTR